MTVTPHRPTTAGSPLDVVLNDMLGHRVRGLSVEVCGGQLILRGQADSYHVKQLAQHAAMAATGLPIAANEIEVVSGPRRKMVLATGDDRVRAIGQDRLTELGWDVATATNGLECVAHLRRSVWDVAVLDANLLWGGADGVLAEIADGASRDLPIVFLGNPPQWRASGNGVRVAAVLEKSFDPDTLVRVVGAVVLAER